MMTHRLCALNGEEDYPVSRITGRRAPEIGLNGGVICEHDVLRMQYGDLMIGRLGAEGGESIAQERLSTQKAEANEKLNPIVEYYVAMYWDFVRDGLLREHAQLKVRLAMNENDEYVDCRRPVNLIMDRDIEINSALKRPHAFDLPSK